MAKRKYFWKNPRSGRLHLSPYEGNRTACGLSTSTLEVSSSTVWNTLPMHCKKCDDHRITVPGAFKSRTDQ